MAGFAPTISWVLGLVAGLALAQTHAGKPVPEFVSGDECLFCHRTIGPSWPKNSHGMTVRAKEELPPALAAALPAGAEYLLGSRTHFAYLKKDGFNRFSLIGPAAAKSFTESCTGCHNTGVDSKSGSFAAMGIDCFACHGNVSLKHSTDTSLVWLSKKKTDDAKAVTAICAQCHLREGGRSKSTGRPWPDNFVAGDDLWADYQADLDNVGLNAGEGHVYRNVRQVFRAGGTTTCLTCHSIHGSGTARHRDVPDAASCEDCHQKSGSKKILKKYTVTSKTCGY